MARDEKKQSKITPENMDEAAKLLKIWESTYADRKKAGLHSQGAFGAEYGIGGQAVVGFFLSGRTALSLKAAQGFARGLGCKIEDFSPRLAATVSDARAYTGSDTSPKEIEELQEVVTRLTTSGKMQLTEVSAIIAMLKAREGP